MFGRFCSPNIIPYVAYGALGKWMVMRLPGLYQVLRIRDVRRMECSFGSMIQDMHICYVDHMQLTHVALMQSLDLCPGEVDRLQEVASTSEAVLGESYSSSRILLDHTF